MGIFSSQAASRLFIQGNQPIGQQTGALWVDSGTTPNPELKIFDGTDWNQQDPVGAIIPFGGAVASIPTGFLLCDGTAVSRTTFANLFDAISTFFGTGDGSTTFNLPDMRAKFQRGAAAAADPGSTGGEDTHALTEGELAAHTHTTKLATDDTPDQVTTGNIALIAVPTGADTTASGSTGSGTAHENRPSFQEVIYIIKT